VAFERTQRVIKWYVERRAAKETHIPPPFQPTPSIPKPLFTSPDVDIRRDQLPQRYGGGTMWRLLGDGAYTSEAPAVAAARRPFDQATIFEDAFGISWPPDRDRMTAWLGIEEGGVAGKHSRQFRYHEVQDAPIQPPPSNPPGWGNQPPITPPGAPDPRGDPPPGFRTWGN
jgi:hypothetical protein